MKKFFQATMVLSVLLIQANAQAFQNVRYINNGGFVARFSVSDSPGQFCWTKSLAVRQSTEECSFSDEERPNAVIYLNAVAGLTIPCNIGSVTRQANTIIITATGTTLSPSCEARAFN